MTTMMPETCTLNTRIALKVMNVIEVVQMLVDKKYLMFVKSKMLTCRLKCYLDFLACLK